MRVAFWGRCLSTDDPFHERCQADIKFGALCICNTGILPLSYGASHRVSGNRRNSWPGGYQSSKWPQVKEREYRKELWQSTEFCQSENTQLLESWLEEFICGQACFHSKPLRAWKQETIPILVALQGQHLCKEAWFMGCFLRLTCTHKALQH